MALSLLFTTSFYRAIKNLDPQQLQIIALLIETLKAYYASGSILSEGLKITPRFVYKKLQGDFYEAGVEGKLRVVIRKEGSNCTAIFAGNHDQIRRFLASS